MAARLPLKEEILVRPQVPQPNWYNPFMFTTKVFDNNSPSWKDISEKIIALEKEAFETETFTSDILEGDFLDPNFLRITPSTRVSAFRN